MYRPTLNSSLLSSRDESSTLQGRKIFDNTGLKLGVVLETIETTDERNVSKLGPEYDVMCIEQAETNGINSSIYKSCLAFDSFGGVADYFQFKLRPTKNPKKVKTQLSFKDQNGTLALILCLDKNSEKAVIVGFMPNPNKRVTLTDLEKNHAEGEFNGLRFEVNNDGAFTLTYRSATDDTGKPSNLTAGGTQIKIEKDGSFQVHNDILRGELSQSNLASEKIKAAEAAPEGIQYEGIRLDKTKKTVDVQSRDSTSFKTDKSFNITAKESMNAKITKDWLVEATGKALYMVKQTFDIKNEGKMGVETQGFKLNSKSMIEMQAQSMVKIIGQSMVDVKSDGLIQLVSGGSMILKGSTVLIGPAPLPAVNMLTKFIGIGNLGGPVISTSLGPFSSSVLIS